MKKIFLFLFLITSILAQAQDFNYEAQLEEIDSSGFYYIFLPPQVTSKLNHKFSDIRIFDGKNSQIPYIRLTDDDIFKTARKIRLRTIQNDHKKQKKYTLVLIHNPQKISINNLDLIIDNQNGEIWTNITGSDDLKNWHILKNNTRYQAELSDSSVTEVRITDIPATSFEYYRIIIYDYNQTVFNVREVYTFDIAPRKKEFVEVEKPEFQQDDTSETGHTILKIRFKQPQYVDKFKFFISSPKYYLRKAELIKKDTVTGQKIRLKYYDQSQKEFYLCSDSTNELYLSRYRVQTVYLVVTNNDDMPLQFSDVKAFQQKEYLIAYLEKEKNYKIKFGNPNVPPPIYDLKFFRNKIPATCPIISVKNIKNHSQINDTDKSVYISPFWLWTALAIVIIILVITSVLIFRNQKQK